MSEKGRKAYSLLSEGTRRWVAAQGWDDLRPIQAESCISLLEEDPNCSLIISANTAGGKALTNDMPVLTTNGWKPIGDIKEGERVYARDGHAYPVTKVYPQGECDVYRLTLSDGRQVDCNLDHKWCVYDMNRKPHKGSKKPWEEVIDTRTMLQRGLMRAQNGAWGKSRKFRIAQNRPVLWTTGDADIELPIDPYVLGILLGDGALSGYGAPALATQDIEIVHEIERRMGDEYYIAKHAGNAYGYTIQYKKQIGRLGPLRKQLRELQLEERADSKFIPQQYLRASTHQRRELLAGLLDSDGYASGTSNTTTFSSTSLQLITDVQELCRSLGFIVKAISVSDRSNQPITGSKARYGKTYYHKSAEYSISISTDECLFFLPRKREVHERELQRVRSSRSSIRKDWTSVVSIEAMGYTAPMTCISVASPDHTYITKDYVVTHNTEAAFLPALTLVDRLMAETDENFVYMLYVAPLKALINDQHRRLSDMASRSGVPVYLWHGDAPQGQKARLMREHCGILMTTPESLESFMMNRGEWVGQYLTPAVIVVDEFHAFLGEGRGRQLLSLLDRVDMVNLQNGREPAVRIGLSATLSQLDKVGRLLSPRRPVAVIDGTQETDDDSTIAVVSFQGIADGNRVEVDVAEMADVIIDDSGAHKTLTFAKSRKDVETMSASINDRCRARGIRSQAFPHHGSLSKETRESLEHRLVSTDKPTMAVATVTLELGIDIGDIYEVFQMGATNTVSSLRQRMGRSGRRGGERNLKCLAAVTGEGIENDLTLLVSEIELMNEGWFEPPNSKRHDASVLVSEILSVLKQYGSAYPDELFALLCEHGGFHDVDEELFHAVIDDMESARLVMFSADGTCLIAEEGEREIGDWHFYATFQSEESFSVKAGNKTIGEITPPSTSLARLVGGGVFMLAGRYWAVQDIDMRNKSITVKQTRQRAEFLVPTSRGGGDVSGMVKRKRISLLVGKDSELVPEYLDEMGRAALEGAREWAKEHHLNGLGLSLYDAGDKGSETQGEVAARLRSGWTDDADTVCNPPVDPAAYDAICRVFELFDMAPGGMDHMPLYRFHDLCEAAIARRDEIEDGHRRLVNNAMVAELREREKFNHYLSDETLRMAYADEVLDLRGAFKWMEAFERFWRHPKRRQM